MKSNSGNFGGGSFDYGSSIEEIRIENEKTLSIGNEFLFRESVNSDYQSVDPKIPFVIGKEEKPKIRLLPSSSSTLYSMYCQMQDIVWLTINADNTVGRVVNYFILGIVGLTFVLFVLSTDDSFYYNFYFRNIYYSIDYTCGFIFTIEYVIRFWSCTSTKSDYYRNWGSILGKFFFIISVLSIIDLLTIIPIYISVIIRIFNGANLVHSLVSLRLLRLLRLFKADRYLNSVQLILKVVYDKRKELITAFFVQFLFICLMSSLIYICEGSNQHQFNSIIKCMYWVIISISTVKGGPDFGHPETLPGHFIEVTLGVACFSSFAVPTSILGAGFLEEHSKMLEKRRRKMIELQRLRNRKNNKKKQAENILSRKKKELLKQQPQQSLPPPLQRQIKTSSLDFFKSSSSLSAMDRLKRPAGSGNKYIEANTSNLMISSKRSQLIFFCPSCKQSSSVELNLMN